MLELWPMCVLLLWMRMVIRSRIRLLLVLLLWIDRRVSHSALLTRLLRRRDGLASAWAAGRCDGIAVGAGRVGGRAVPPGQGWVGAASCLLLLVGRSHGEYWRRNSLLLRLLLHQRLLVCGCRVAQRPPLAVFVQENLVNSEGGGPGLLEHAEDELVDFESLEEGWLCADRASPGAGLGVGLEVGAQVKALGVLAVAAARRQVDRPGADGAAKGNYAATRLLLLLLLQALQLFHAVLQSQAALAPETLYNRSHSWPVNQMQHEHVAATTGGHRELQGVGQPRL